MIYFTYGSNLDQKQMKDRCKDSELIGKGCLKGYILTFDKYSPGWDCGVADIIKSSNNEVWGLLYSVSKKDLTKLDDYEGHPNFYRRATVKVKNMNGEFLEAITYKVVHKEKFVAPSEEYFNIIKTAAQKHNFPISYISFGNVLRE